MDDIQVGPAITDVASRGPQGSPRATTLYQNTPNPFNPSTTIRFSTPTAGEAALVVLDVAGRRVRTLFGGAIPAGEHHYAWDGRNERGDAMPSGVYLYQLQMAEGTSSRRMVLVR